jgi:phosphoglycolate phosphatase-like HAD superfamily hydrolase
MKTMPAHPDCEEGVKMLKDAGFRMVTLTNSPPTPGGKSPLENAGLDRFFERQFSIETARAYKPDPATYHQNSMCPRRPAAWWRRMFGIRSEVRASVWLAA